MRFKRRCLQKRGHGSDSIKAGPNTQPRGTRAQAQASRPSLLVPLIPDPESDNDGCKDTVTALHLPDASVIHGLHLHEAHAVRHGGKPLVDYYSKGDSAMLQDKRYANPHLFARDDWVEGNHFGCLFMLISTIRSSWLRTSTHHPAMSN